MKLNSSRNIALCAVIAALYCVLTTIFMPISFGAVQLRVSEALCVLPMLAPAAPVGLFLGCLIGNIIGGASIFDIIFGSLATLAAGFLTYKLRKHKWLAPLPAVVINAVVVGALLRIVYGVPLPLYMCMLYVAAGQAVSCYGFGMPLYFLLSNRNIAKKLF